MVYSGMFSIVLLIVTLSIPAAFSDEITFDHTVKIFHIIDNALWGEVDGSFLQGNFTCGRIDCRLYSSDTKSNFMSTIRKKYKKQFPSGIDSVSLDLKSPISVALYNIHTWKTMSKAPHTPGNTCQQLPTDLSVAESEESHSRFGHLFDNAFPYFDGYSTTHPAATIPRFYVSSLNSSQFLPAKPFKSLIKGATFVASTCHRGKGTTKRESVVTEMMWHGLRVDSLGKCMQSPVGPEGVTLETGATALESLQLKQKAISNYMFHLAFENTYEPGYVTEKVFDALIAGVVPVYLGPAKDCRKLLPAPNAAIFIDDFNGNISEVSSYLKRLVYDESAYEAHRAWRKPFIEASESGGRDFLAIQNPVLSKSWPCRICDWAVNTMNNNTSAQAAEKLLHIENRRRLCGRSKY